MRAAVRKLGNSSGVIIPKALLRDLGVAEGDPVEMTLEAGRIVLVPIKRRARAGWVEASESIAEARDDAIVWPQKRSIAQAAAIFADHRTLALLYRPHRRRPVPIAQPPQPSDLESVVRSGR